MVWQQSSRFQNNPLLQVLKYSNLFTYSLTDREVWFWQIKSQWSLVKVRRHLKDFPLSQGYYYLPGQKKQINKRFFRQNISLKKWKIAISLANLLSKTPSIFAIFVTGALAMNNSPINDDIDIMIITAPHTLWITRLFISAYLKISGKRREPHLPEHSSPRVKDKICDNLWLDTDHLSIFPHNLYQAHEILQAKCIFDRGGIHYQFLKQNSWVGEYLPIAYRESLKKILPTTNSTTIISILFLSLLEIINYPLFILQFLYMFPHKHNERIGPGFALFHPRKNLGYDMI